jgi:hypothetical protein
MSTRNVSDIEEARLSNRQLENLQKNLRVDPAGKIVPTPEATDQVRAENPSLAMKAASDDAAAAHLWRLAQAQTLIWAMEGSGPYADTPQP